MNKVLSVFDFKVKGGSGYVNRDVGEGLREILEAGHGGNQR